VTLIVSLAVGILFAAGSYLLLQHDFIKVVGGTILITHSVNLFIMVSGLSRGTEPIYPLVPGEPVSDPVVQAMVLTAIVISFGVTALLISLIYRVYVAHRSVDIEHLSDFEERLVQLEEQQVPPEPGIGVLEDREDDDDDESTQPVVGQALRGLTQPEPGGAG
jgi:multicomponent Na+:H+ antiporter subunit C